MHENPAHAIITGGSSGIGLSVACLLAKEGVRLCTNDRAWCRPSLIQSGVVERKRILKLALA
jgi:NAD(P)-dependent dehydrogenase (short-subunit alcohol dehydrogenase family)